MRKTKLWAQAVPSSIAATGVLQTVPILQPQGHFECQRPNDQCLLGEEGMPEKKSCRATPDLAVGQKSKPLPGRSPVNA